MHAQCEARPVVSFLAAGHHLSIGTKLHCLVTELHACKQLAQGRYLKGKQLKSNARTLSQVLHLNQYTAMPHFLLACRHDNNTNLLVRASGITSNFTSWTFSVSAPSTWNLLPAQICIVDNLSTFKSPHAGASDLFHNFGAI